MYGLTVKVIQKLLPVQRYAVYACEDLSFARQVRNLIIVLYIDKLTFVS